MLVTIITVSFNSAMTIRRTIESVLNQTYPNIEYIIVDGASKDKTLEIANEYRKQFQQKGYSYRIVSEPDHGMYDALNKGAKLATGELVGQINSDDWYYPNAVEIMVNLFKEQQYDAAWGSINVHSVKGNFVKHAHIGWLWTTSGWCHPGMFSKREILLSHPYALESMYDDFDYITGLHCEGKHLVTTDKLIANFSFGGMSTKKSWDEVKRRIAITYGIYRKHGMSRFYWLHRLAIETAKYILG